MKTILFILLCTFTQSLCAKTETFFDRHAEGWHWYQDPVRVDEPKPETKRDRESPHKSESKTSQKIKKKMTPSEQIAKERQELQEALDAALVDPNPETLKRYIVLQSRMLNEAEKFAHVWQKVVMMNPDLDETLKNPVDQNALHVYYAEKNKATQKKIQALAKDYGLFFFFKGQCPYCHEFAPIVKRFSEKYGWSVLAISMDGGTLKEFPKAKRDNGAATRLQLQHVPALMAIHPKTGQIIPLAYGMVSEEEIEIRALALTDHKPTGARP